MSRKLDYTYFELSNDKVQCFYTIRGGELKVGIKSKVQKLMYYNYLDEAYIQAIKHYNSHHSVTKVNSIGELYKI